jgi:hypothetical protein
MMPNQALHGEGSKNAAGFRYIITAHNLASFHTNFDRSPSGKSSQQPQPLSPWPDHPYCKTEKFLHDTRGIVNDHRALQMFLPRLDYILKDIDRVDKAFEEHTSTHEQQHDTSHTSATPNRDLNSSGVKSSAVESRTVEEMTHHQVQSRGRGNGRSISTRGRHHPGSQNNSKRPNPTDLSSSSGRGSSNHSDDSTTPKRRGRTGKRVRFT